MWQGAAQGKFLKVRNTMVTYDGESSHLFTFLPLFLPNYRLKGGWVEVWFCVRPIWYYGCSRGWLSPACSHQHLLVVGVCYQHIYNGWCGKHTNYVFLYYKVCRCCHFINTIYHFCKPMHFWNIASESSFFSDYTYTQFLVCHSIISSCCQNILHDTSSKIILDHC